MLKTSTFFFLLLRKNEKVHSNTKISSHCYWWCGLWMFYTTFNNI